MYTEPVQPELQLSPGFCGVVEGIEGVRIVPGLFFSRIRRSYAFLRSPPLLFVYACWPSPPDSLTVELEIYNVAESEVWLIAVFRVSCSAQF